jgi:catechol 2,3-dioxygenase-like lactoylglutathione lyase family enzyme
MASITGAHHMALTVRDADRSAAWYSDLFGMQTILSGDEDDVKYRVLAHPCGWILGVREYPGKADGEFDEFRTGLDHFAFGVEDRAALEAWEQELSKRNITFTPIADAPIGSVIAFRDPDNIQLEFWLSKF